jgi:hypothetical protein
VCCLHLPALLLLQSQSNPWAFCLSYWELYGHFYKLRDAASSTHKEGCTV